MTQIFRGSQIEAICGEINVDNSYEKFTELVREISGECLNVNYNMYIEFQRNDTLDAESVRTGSRQGLWKQCTQLGWFITSTEENHPFGSRVPIELWVNICNDIFDFK